MVIRFIADAVVRWEERCGICGIPHLKSEM